MLVWLFLPVVAPNRKSHCSFHWTVFTCCAQPSLWNFSPVVFTCYRGRWQLDAPGIQSVTGTRPSSGPGWADPESGCRVSTHLPHTGSTDAPAGARSHWRCSFSCSWWFYSSTYVPPRLACPDSEPRRSSSIQRPSCLAALRSPWRLCWTAGWCGTGSRGLAHSPRCTSSPCGTERAPGPRRANAGDKLSVWSANAEVR